MAALTALEVEFLLPENKLEVPLAILENKLEVPLEIELAKFDKLPKILPNKPPELLELLLELPLVVKLYDPKP